LQGSTVSQERSFASLNPCFTPILISPQTIETRFFGTKKHQCNLGVVTNLNMGSAPQDQTPAVFALLILVQR
jgi:hypothetical protein